MITLPANLQAFMQGQDLTGLKPFAVLFRNKWVDESGSADEPHYELDLANPIDISDLIVKPNTLSMTLDVNEVAQYNCNNVTLTLSDTKNYFVEGTPNSYFPEGYQIYGSRVVLYYGLDSNDRTALFTGSIKELPTHKPEKYQVDLKLVSPLEMLKDIEAKGFSDKVIGETLTYKSTDTDGHRIYWTNGTGVGGFNAVYAGATKIFDGVDYEVSQLSAFGLPAIVKIINSAYYASTITADYYTWKKNLTVEQIVAGLVGLAGYDSQTEDIRNVVWNSSVRSVIPIEDVQFALGYSLQGENWVCSWPRTLNSWSVIINDGTFNRPCVFPKNMEVSFSFYYGGNGGTASGYSIFNSENTSTRSGYTLYNDYLGNNGNYRAVVRKCTNGVWADLGIYDTGSGTVVRNSPWKVVKQNNSYSFYYNGHLVASDTSAIEIKFESILNYYDTSFGHGALRNRIDNMLYKVFDDYGTLLFSVSSPCIMSKTLNKLQATEPWSSINGTLEGNSGFQYELFYSTSVDSTHFSDLSAIDLGSEIGQTEQYLYFLLKAKDDRIIPFNITNLFIYILSSTLFLSIVNLSSKSVLEALQDFALISGYEFGVDRNGVFFFRPRVQSTIPTYVLDHNELVKVDTVKKNFSDFFTKLTLTFAQVPLEFYANTGTRPTPIDKYGVINKEIDKPDIVNYDNPELAQAIGPQLLEVYSAFPNIIQCVGKLNLALELGDIVSLRRNMNLITPDYFTDYTKYSDLNTYYRACKITGLNYNFAKKQITYTLRDVSDKNTQPEYEFNEYIYDNPVQYGVKE